MALSQTLRKLPWVALALGSWVTACDFDQLHNPGITTGAGGGTDGTSSATSSGASGAAPGAGGAAATAAATSSGASTGSTSSASVSTGAGGAATGAGGAATGAGGGTITGAGGATGGLSGASGGGGSAGGLGDAGMDASAGLDAQRDGAGCNGYALELNGTSAYASIARSVQDDFTLEAWIKPSATLAVLTGTNLWNGYGLLYADVPSTTNDFGASMLNGKLAFGVGNPDTNVQSASSIPNGQWTHVAATRNMATGDIQVIINGVLDGTLATTQKGSLTAPPTITIGANTIDGHYFAGLIDEVRLWSVVRTPAQITASMRQRLTGSEPGLVGYYRFDEGTGIAAADSSPTKGNATLASGAGATGLPTWVASDAPVCP